MDKNDNERTTSYSDNRKFISGSLSNNQNYITQTRATLLEAYENVRSI